MKEEGVLLKGFKWRVCERERERGGVEVKGLKGGDFF